MFTWFLALPDPAALTPNLMHSNEQTTLWLRLWSIFLASRAGSFSPGAA
jgi:hypothetical protein